jgi:hypothetical protein
MSTRLEAVAAIGVSQATISCQQARPEHLTPDIRQLFKRNILDSLGCAVFPTTSPGVSDRSGQSREQGAPCEGGVQAWN